MKTYELIYKSEQFAIQTQEETTNTRCWYAGELDDQNFEFVCLSFRSLFVCPITISVHWRAGPPVAPVRLRKTGWWKCTESHTSHLIYKS